MSYTSPSYGVGWRHGQAIDTITASPYYTLATSYFAGRAPPAADMAVYIPVLVRRRVVVRRLFLPVVGVAGNVDIGIYDAGGTRIVSTGLTTAATDLTVDITDTTIGPGFYYLAYLGSDTGTLTIVGMSSAVPLPAACGVLTEQMGAGGSLPATATWVVNDPSLTKYYVIAAITDTVIT